MVFAFLAASLPAVTARAENGLFNLHLELGGTALATDTAVKGVKRAGLDLTVRADYPLPMFRMLAPQITYAFDFLPGKSGVQAFMAGLRVRPLNDESGYFASLWPSKARKGSIWGNLFVSASLGYVYAPTASDDNHWFGFGFEAGCEFSVASPIQMGPYVRYQQVVFTGKAKDPIFIGFGLSISFGYPTRMPAQAAKAPPPKPRVAEEVEEPMADPGLAGRPGDKDGDGVPDEKDQCPITAPRVEVEATGCMALKGKMVFWSLQFNPKTTVLTGKGVLALKRLSDVLKANKSVSVSVSVFADDHQNAVKDLDLANKRAQVVRRRLIRFGMDQKRITSVGSRPQPPPAESPVPLDRWNKRVEFRFQMGG